MGNEPNTGTKPPVAAPGVESNDALIVATRTACREAKRKETMSVQDHKENAKLFLRLEAVNPGKSSGDTN